ncbi:molybdate ABC transporter permease subunit [Tibeticola sp.]|uniref:molybdate ABC transporter permease subunit n=1 Tax=Tibeticola sp. TaxID=2005368 RepID=UPI00258884C3|nr:molybdate ABC transporter permease subunit [Tibeticola sp.]MCI4439758.1 molybdate ABC transporter permease subunit [Tibeticola sp.]
MNLAATTLGLTADEWLAIRLTAELAAATTLILLLLGAPLAWWLTRSASRWANLVSAAVSLPLVLPPTVIGFYLLIALGPEGFIGRTLERLGAHHLAFSFGGILIGSVIYSLPFAVQPLREGFAGIDPKLLDAAATLRARGLDRFFSVVLPLSRSGILTAVVLSFAHTVGEFGVIAMLGGNIAGETRVVSIAIYDHTQAMEYAAAHRLSAVLLGFSFVTLLAFYALNQRALRPAKLG